MEKTELLAMKKNGIIQALGEEAWCEEGWWRWKPKKTLWNVTKV